MKTELRLPAIEVWQSPARALYSFAVDAKLVPSFATVSRIHRRGEERELQGYQRPEVLAHIEEIRAYIESESPMIPNAIVLAFDNRVHFELTGEPSIPYARPGVIVIPVDDSVSEEERPGFIVDGQQRLAAIRDAMVDSFPICVSAFITNDAREQMEQFILVNSTKPLPKGLIYELLPGTEAALPSLLQRRRLPAYLLSRLNLDKDSPLAGMIRTVTNTGGTIKDTSILRMIENSLKDGVLNRWRLGSGAEPDVESMLNVLYAFWRAVSKVFKDAWKLKAKESRLVTGAGIVSLGYIMDDIAERYRSKGKGLPTEAMFMKDLRALQPICHWTEGVWDFGPKHQRKWNDIQNTPKDIDLLSNYLRNQYKNRVWTQGAKARGRQLILSGA
jgi:DGQHR domain-containing protein